MQMKTYMERWCKFYIKNRLSVDDYEFNMRENYQHLFTVEEKAEFERILARCVRRIRYA